MEEHDHGNKDPVILTSPGRMMRGIVIVGVTLAVGAGVVLTLWDEMFANPPPVSQIRQPTQPTPPAPPAEAGTTTIAILLGAATQGNPDYDPDEDAKVPLGNKVVWDNQDTAVHTATSGTGPQDPNNAVAFDTGIINGGERSKVIEIKDAKVGDVFDYYCLVHPYMTSKLTIVEASASGGGAPTDSSPIENLLTIPLGAQTQGNPSYEPKEMTVKKGSTILVVNEDTALHTVTNGKGPSDAESAKFFDSGIIEPGGRIEINTVNLTPREYDYYCLVHPFMVGKLTITE